MLRFVDLLSDIANDLGYYYTSSSSTDIDSDTTNYPRLNRMKRLINDAYETMQYMMPREFLRRERTIKIPEPYETGTIQLGAGTDILSGTDATWTRNMQMRQLLPADTYRPMFLKKFSNSGVYYMESNNTDAAVADGTSYTMASWAIPLPYDWLAPFDEEGVWDITNRCRIPMINRKEFRARYPFTYQTGTPSLCTIDGVTTFARSGTGNTCSVTNGSASVQFGGSYVIDGSEQGGILKLEGDSTRYVIERVEDPDAAEVTPVVQIATNEAASYEIDPAPLPLLWFNVAPSEEFYVRLRYHGKPEYLWTDEQVVKLAGDYRLAFTRLAAFNVISAFSRDQMQKQEAMQALTMALKAMPKEVDTAPIFKQINSDATREYGITFPNVGLAEDAGS